MLSNRQLFLQHVAQTTDFPMGIEVERAEGIYLHGPNGEKWMDLISGISVSNLGHNHPAIVEAVKNQADKFMHLMVYGEYINGPQVELAQQLAANLPQPLEASYFVNSGSEAIEGALKLAKRATGRSELISFNNAYHGSTHGALSIQGSETYKTAFRPLLPDCKQLNYNDESQLTQITERTAAVVVEAVQAEAGIVTPNAGYLQALRKRCTETGTLLILDEIQTGFGRTGHLFGMAHSGIIPDIVCVAKAMGGGMPIGAFIASQELMGTLRNNPILGHITTFGGHPVSCAAALANLNTLLSSDLIAQVAAKEALFRTHLTHPAIKEIRSCGLMLAVEFESFQLLQVIIQQCIDRGVLVDWFLFNDCSMRIGPPLIITEEEIIDACGRITEAIRSILGD